MAVWCVVCGCVVVQLWTVQKHVRTQPSRYASDKILSQKDWHANMRSFVYASPVQSHVLLEELGAEKSVGVLQEEGDRGTTGLG